MGLSKSPQEVLVGTTNNHDCANGSTYRIYSRVCGGTFHLLDFLERMTRKTPEYILKIAGISFGFAFSFVILEISARLLPASDTFSQKLPLNCKSPISNFSEIDEDCLFRRAEYTSGVYTKGKFPPFAVHANKTTNDIGQFSDVDFSEITTSSKEVLPIISIGDSYVEAMQVSNPKTFHGLLNQYVGNNGEKIVSTAIGSSGNPLSQYLVSAMFARKNSNNPNSILIFTIISNDFDESIVGYKGVQFGGLFKLSEDGRREHVFINRTSSPAITIRRSIFNISALSRYLMMNLKVSNWAYTYPFCMLADYPCNKIKNFKANIVETSESADFQRYEKSRKASDIFLLEISKLRDTSAKRKNTVFAIDAHRNQIYDTSLQKSEYFTAQRNYFINKAKSYGFTVIDMEPVFSNHYQKNKQKFEFSNDGHWNSIGHKVVSKEIAKRLDLMPKN